MLEPRNRDATLETKQLTAAEKKELSKVII